MMHSFLEGTLLGLTLSVLVGPALFALIQTSIHRGFVPAVILSVGIFLSDLTLVVLCYLGIISFFETEGNRLLFGIISSAILISFGLVTFKRKPEIIDENNNDNSIRVKTPGHLTYLLKGYFLNIANPFVWFFWIGVTFTITTNYSSDKSMVLQFFAGTLSSILVTDILKSYLAKKTRRFFTVKYQHRLNQTVGVLLVLSGIVLIVRVLYYFFQ